MLKKPKNDAEFREQMARKFIEVLEKEGLSWKKTWISSGNPINGGSKRPYKGINAFLLSMISLTEDWGRRWYTFHQISDPRKICHPNEKWHLKKGAKAAYVEYWYPFDTVQKKQVTWKEYKTLLDSGRDPDEFFLRATFTPVFNESQIEGISREVFPDSGVTDVSDIVMTIAGNMHLEICYDGKDRAFYRPADDTLHLPEPKQFHSQAALNATALHELAHATGHESRLNRDIRNTFGTDAYAFEELVAEMTSCFMSIRLPELEDEHMLENHQAYVKSWISDLKEQPKILSDAIKKAMEAAEYMDRMSGIVQEHDLEDVRATA